MININKKIKKTVWCIVPTTRLSTKERNEGKNLNSIN